MDFKTKEGRMKFLKSIKSVTFTKADNHSIAFAKHLNMPFTVTRINEDCFLEVKNGYAIYHVRVFNSDGTIHNNTFRTTEFEIADDNNPEKIIDSIRDMIDVALDFGDEERFMELTSMLKQITEKGRQLA